MEPMKWARNFFRSIVFVLITALVINLNISPVITGDFLQSLINLIIFAVMLLILEIVVEEVVARSAKGRSYLYQIAFYAIVILVMTAYMVFAA
ncbi:hypothetical protein JXB01_01505 [Candidatus Micrarchaeota archaeon]|nr:hypothetical protein [Candidatus Micrarchaeota archaeon]